MNGRTAIIVLVVALVSVLAFNGINININHTFSFQMDDKPATMEEVILSLLEEEGQYSEPELFLIQPQYEGFGAYQQDEYLPFFKGREDWRDTDTIPRLELPMTKEQMQKGRDALIGPPLYKMQPGDLGDSEKASPPEPAEEGTGIPGPE